MKVMVIVKANKDSEAGVLPDEKMLSSMMKYNEELNKAGVLLDLAGLQPTSAARRVRFAGPHQRTVIDGPFAEAKELIAGYWILQVKSMDEALEWVKRAPMEDTELEVRPFFDLADFPDASAETIERGKKIESSLNRA